MMTGSAAAILDDVLARAGQPAAGDAVTFRGADPILPTAFRVGDLGAAAIAAAGLHAARLYAHRTGVHQQVDVDVDAAAAAMRSWTYLKEVPEPPPGPPKIGGAFYATADDRWIFLHRAAEHHFARQLAVLGCDRDEESLVAAVRRWSAEELEQAVVDAGASAAVVRTDAEWAAHEQGIAVAAMPLFTITKIGESDPIPVGAGDRPLGGVRVLDLTASWPGRPPPAPSPSTAPTSCGSPTRTSSTVDPCPATPATASVRRLDLRTADDAALLRHLLRDADVFSQGYRPGALAAWLPSDELAVVRPGIVSISISAYGTTGPWRERRGFDSVVEAGNGIADEIGGAGKPGLIPTSPLDYTSGYLAAFLVQVALDRRAREGGSYHIELSLAQTGHTSRTCPGPTRTPSQPARRNCPRSASPS